MQDELNLTDQYEAIRKSEVDVTSKKSGSKTAPLTSHGHDKFGRGSRGPSLNEKV